MIHIIIVDSQKEYRNDLCDYLSLQNDFSVDGTGEDSYQAVKLVDTYKPDIVLMDINLPLGDGVKTAALIKYRSPHTSVIINWDGKERRIFSVLFNCVSGYITKQKNGELLCHAIRAVYYGGSLIAPEIALRFKKITTSLAGNILKTRGDLRSLKLGRSVRKSEIMEVDSSVVLPQTFSFSELQIIGFVGRGLTNKEIAEKLCLTEGTIRNYVSSVLQKIGLRDRTQMAIYAVKAGL